MKRSDRKKVVGPADKRECAKYLIDQHSISCRKACQTLKISRTVYQYQQAKNNDSEVIDKLNNLAGLKPQYGFWKMYDTLRLEGQVWNHKKVYRIYTSLKMNLRRKHKRRLPVREAKPINVPSKLNDTWSMDFMSDALFNGRKVRILNIIDDHNRQAVGMEVDFSLTAARVIDKLNQAIELNGKPLKIRTDNGPEFISKKISDWCHKNRIQHQFIQPGKPVQNSLIERFNGSYRNEILDAYIFYSLEELQNITREWMQEYNYKRPHDALNGLPPALYVLKYGKHDNNFDLADMFTTFQHAGDDSLLIEKTNFEVAL